MHSLSGEAATKKWASTKALAASLPVAGSAQPIYCLYPDALRLQARQIMACLPRPFYAVKANTLPLVLECLVAEGLTHFDVASMLELHTVLRAEPKAVCAFMNPVKQEADIQEAYRLGVRIFALDSMDELDKILRATRANRAKSGASGCSLLVRLSLAPKRSVYDMTGKFGAGHAEAVALLQKIATSGLAAGITFHVGSQCEHPASYAEAIDEAARVAGAAGVSLAALDVGGGFPARYKGCEPEMMLFGERVAASFATHRSAFGAHCELQSEPGRSLVAGAGSVLVRVELRRGNTLFLNEGLHGLLSELRWMPGFHPVRRVAGARHTGISDPGDFSFAGPTCDSGDFMKGPYALPSDMKAGDWIEIGFLGAYCVELVTPFNGFGRYDMAVIQGTARWNESEHLSESEHKG